MRYSFRASVRADAPGAGDGPRYPGSLVVAAIKDKALDVAAKYRRRRGGVHTRWLQVAAQCATAPARPVGRWRRQTAPTTHASHECSLASAKHASRHAPPPSPLPRPLLPSAPPHSHAHVDSATTTSQEPACNSPCPRPCNSLLQRVPAGSFPGMLACFWRGRALSWPACSWRP